MRVSGLLPKFNHSYKAWKEIFVQGAGETNRDSMDYATGYGRLYHLQPAITLRFEIEPICNSHTFQYSR